MKTGSASRDAFFNLRVLFGFGLSSVGVFLALMALSINSSSTGVAAGANKGVTIIHSYHNDVSPAMRDVNPWPVHRVQEHEAAENPKISTGFHRDMPDLVVQKETLLGRLAPSIPAPILTFAGIPFPGVGCGCAPPDTNGEVGATQYVQSVNRGYQVFDKATGASVFGPASIESVWTGFGGVCETSGLGDPVLLYDQLANRWIISEFAGTSIPTDECIAVSTASDATGTFNRYAFHVGSNFFDYEKISVWPDAYYMSAIIFDSSGTVYLGPQAYAMDRASMLAGQPATLIAMPILGSSFPPMLPSDFDGSTLPPPGAPNSFVLYPDTGTYRVFHFHVDFAIPANSTFTLFGSSPAAGFTEICPGFRNCVPELGQSSANWLDAIGDRLMFRLAYRNFGGHESVVGNFTASSNSVAGIRWFELRGMTAGPVTTFQESTYQPDTTWRFQGSIAMDQQGNMALGYSASDATIFPQLRYTGRLASDPLNSMPQGEAHLFDGTGAQTDTFNRWGDYSDMTIDPVDDCTFWYATEYYDTTSSFNWRTRIGNFKFAQCGGGGMLWYNGDFDGVNGLDNEQDTSLGAGQFAHVYDDFDVTDSNGWNVTSVYSDNLVSTNIAGATWEIRQGISEGDGGSLIASGMTMTPTVTVTGRSGMGLSEFQVEVTGLSVSLPAGSYFLNVTPQGDLTGRAFDSTTSGANCVGTPCGNNQNAFFDSNFFDAVFTSTANFGQPSDFSMGVNGTVNPPPPVITSPPTDTATVGQSFSYQITATNNPTSFNATELPANLTVDTSTGLISGTPSAAGIFSITLSATNAGGTGTAPLTLTVVNPPPPVITSPPTDTATVGQSFSYQITATSNPTSFSATGLPANLTVDASTGVISGTPSTAGIFSINLSATNAGGTGTATLTLTVNPAPPVITSPSSATGKVGQAFTYQITATNAPTSFNATGLPAGLTMNTTSGLISGTPTAAGTFSVTLSATNAGGTGTATLTLTVNPAPPVITSPSSATGTVGQAFSYQITATNSPTSFNATGLPAGLTVDTGTGLISGTPTATGTFSVNLSATNDSGTGTAVLTLTVAATSSAPVITSADSANATVGQLFSYQISATNSPTSFGASGLPAGLTVDTGTGLISGVPSAPGDFSVSLSATNASGTGTAVLTLHVIGTPAAPVITSPSSASAVIDQFFSYQIVANNSPSSFGATGLPVGLSINAGTGLISGASSVAGDFSINLSASNASGTGTAVLTLHVAATVSAPVVISPLTATTTVGELFVYQIMATNQPTSYAATNLPAGLTVDSGGTITGTATTVGTKQVILSASNAAGTGTATLVLEVQGVAVNDGIDIISGSSVTGRTGAPFTYQVIATGITSDATITTTALPAGLTIDLATGLIAGTPSQDGSFGVEVTVHEGTRTATFSLQLTFTSDPGFPVITSAANVTLIRGQPFSYTITAPNSADPVTDPTTFSISGSLPAGLTFDPATGTISGTFVNRIIKALSGGTIVGISVPSASVIGSVQLFANNSHGTGTQTLTFFAPLPQLLNISTRMQVLTDDKVLIGGFIITGNAPKKVILRAIGPSLTSFGLSDALADPVLELHLPDMTVVTNDNWKDTQQTEIEATGLQPGSDKESAIVATLAPGVYTAIVSGKDGGTGIGLVEAYDLDQAADSTLANISTRGFVDTGDNVMIGGVIIGGETGQVLVRAIGPELTAFGVNGALEDTTLELHDKDGALITSNDDWKETQQAVIEATGLAPKDDRESAILSTLAPDIYTAIVRGKDGTTGVALVEAYNVSP